MIQKPIVEQSTQHKFDPNHEEQDSLGLQQIICEIEEQEDLQIDEGNHQSDKTTFVQVPSIKIGLQIVRKSVRVNDFLNKNPVRALQVKKQQTSLEEQLFSIKNVQLQNKQSEQFILKFNSKPSQAVEIFVQKKITQMKGQQELKQKKEKQNLEKQKKVISRSNSRSKSKSKNQQKDKQQTETTQKETIVHPKLIAQHLLSMRGLDKTVLGEYFGKNNPRILQILHQFCNLLDFKNMEFDLALRKLLSKFRLPGESQQIQRVIWEFSLSFYQQNRHIFDNADQLFPLAYSIIMLATDAHNPKQQKKMSAQQFVRNTQRPCPSIEKQYLEHIYNRITKQKLQTQNNDWQVIYARLRDMISLPQIMNELQQNTNKLKKGSVVLKICRDNNKIPFSNPKQSKFVQRKIYLSEDYKRVNWISDPSKGDQQPRFIQLDDVIDLTLGIAPHLKKYNKVPKQFDSLCFTITTCYRNLDLKARSTKQRSLWLNYLRAVMIKRRQLKIKQIQQQQKTLFGNREKSQVLEQAWNGQIFPNWDKYWDYSLKKPKKKGYFTRGIQALCGCFQTSSQNVQNQINDSAKLGVAIKNNLLQTVWKYGLRHSSRKTLWVQIIGNPLQLNKIMIDHIKSRTICSFKLKEMLRQIKEKQNKKLKKDKNKQDQANQERQLKEVRFMTQFLIALRPDLPHVKQLLLMSKVFYDVISKQSHQKNASIVEQGGEKVTRRRRRKFQEKPSADQKQSNNKQNQSSQGDNEGENSKKANRRKYSSKSKYEDSSDKQQNKNQSCQKDGQTAKYVPVIQNSLISFANLIHKHHFLSFFRGQMSQIEGRTQLFEVLLQKNAPSVLDHFKAIKLETRMYLVSWFISVFSVSFKGQFLWRIWDNFLLQQQVYLFKVGITIVKYYQTQLKMCTFSQGLNLLKQPLQPSAALFFHILQNQINVTPEHYHYYIQKRKYAIIKTKVQSIPLE